MYSVLTTLIVIGLLGTRGTKVSLTVSHERGEKVLLRKVSLNIKCTGINNLKVADFMVFFCYCSITIAVFQFFFVK